MSLFFRAENPIAIEQRIFQKYHLQTTDAVICWIGNGHQVRVTADVSWKTFISQASADHQFEWAGFAITIILQPSEAQGVESG